MKACRRLLWSEHLNLSKDDDLFKDPLRAIRRMAETAAANGKKSGNLDGRLVPMTFDVFAVLASTALQRDRRRVLLSADSGSRHAISHRGFPRGTRS